MLESLRDSRQKCEIRKLCRRKILSWVEVFVDIFRLDEKMSTCQIFWSLIAILLETSWTYSNTSFLVSKFVDNTICSSFRNHLSHEINFEFSFFTLLFFPSLHFQKFGFPTNPNSNNWHTILWTQKFINPTCSRCCAWR